MDLVRGTRGSTLKIVVEVPAVNVGKEPFQKLLVASGGRGLLFFSSSCCAVVALPSMEDAEAMQCL